MNTEQLKNSLLDAIKEQFSSLYEYPWDYQVDLLKYSENVIYRITPANVDGDTVVFRVHRPGYHDMEELQSEMIWMDEIANDTDVFLPKVYKGKDGNFLQTLTVGEQTYNCSVISFLEGDALGDLKGSALEEAVRQVGEITAKLHIQSMNRDETKMLKRFSWDLHNFFDEDGVWGSWRDFPGLSQSDMEVLGQAQLKIIDELEVFGRTKEHYGLIHADLHFYNVINNHGINQIFDFDDCGYGFFMYDLGCTLVTYSANLDSLMNAWVSGYEKIRPLNMEEKRLLPMFVLLRRIVRLAWLASHSSNDVFKTVGDEYLRKTIIMAKEWCK